MLKLKVPTMSCGHCTSTIEKAVKAIDPAAKLTPDLGSSTVLIESTAADAAVRAAIQTAGYENELLAV